jgi:hypothetical protein
MYTKQEISEMLQGYREIKKSKLVEVPIFTRIRYCDERFKAGGMLLSVDNDNETITLKNGTFIWKVKLKKIKNIWIPEPQILEQKEIQREIRKEERQKEKDDEKKEIEKCKELIRLIKSGEIEIIRKKSSKRR